MLAACGTPRGSPAPAPDGSAPTGLAAVDPTAPRPIPVPGHELYGFVPYWEMDDTIVAHLAATPLTTIGLFSVTHTGKGAIRQQKGLDILTSDIGRQVIREAHDRGTAVELVYTSFGRARNVRLFADITLQAALIASLVALVGDLGLDGIDVDVEVLDSTLVPAYGQFVHNLRAAVVAADPGDKVSVATGAGALGAGMAAAAAGAGADRIFLMGYDYRTGASDPGASSPLERREGPEEPSLRSSLDLYLALGVPAEKTLLGLPLYGVTWPVAGPFIGAPSTGRGDAWILRKHVDVLGDPAIVPLRDEVEVVEVYLFGSDGSVGPPTAAPTVDPSADATAPASGGPSAVPSAPSTAAPSTAAPSTPDVGRTWQAVYVDSPATLAVKLALANGRGLAGAGFWAIGYERGLPGYTRLMEQFTDGSLGR